MKHINEKDYKDIYHLFEKSYNHKIEAARLEFEAATSLMQKVTGIDTNFSQVVHSLLAPENGGVYDIDQAADILQISKSTLYKWVKEGKLESTKPNNGKLMFQKYQISEFLNK